MNGLIKVFRNLLYVLLFGFASCSNNDRLEPFSDTDYFPLQIGQSSEFDLQRTVYSATELPEIKNYTIRRLVADSFKDLQDHWTYKIEYAVQNGQKSWKTDSFTTVRQTAAELLVQENGQTILTQIYPVSEGTSWNGNCYNSIGELKFRYTKTGHPYQTESGIFQKTITIVRQDDSTLLSRNKYIEVYAQDVGLVSVEKIFLQYCSTPDCRGKGIITSGWTERTVIKNFGK